MELKKYIESNSKRFLDELLDLLRIPSVSADPAYKKEVFTAAEYVKSSLEAAGVDQAEICNTDGYPIVYGEKIIDPAAPTVLVYGHYDVQPADPLELWDSPPFEPVIKKTESHPNGAIFARGSADDKGQFYMHVKAFEAMLTSGQLNCNVKFMIEGEEEVGSENLDVFVRNNQEKLKADVVLISDTSMISLEHPSVTVGLKGLTYMEVEVTGPNKDLHSGTFGGAVANPINILCKMISSLHDEDNRIGEGAKTVLPSKANAKISMRLVPNQDHKAIAKLFEEHFKSIAPPAVKVKVVPHHGGQAAVIPTDSIGYKAAEAAIDEAFGKKAIPTREGGSIPITSLFQQVLGLNPILLGFGLDTDAIHSPNEHYGVDNYFKGIETIALFFKHFHRLSSENE